jgi:urease alpha subunit
MESTKNPNMDPDIIVPVTDQNTKQILDAIGCHDKTYKELKTTHDPRKVRRAMQALEDMSNDLNKLLLSMTEDLSQSMNIIGEVTIIKRYQKKHEGRIKEHVRLGDNIEVVKNQNSTFIRVKTKNPINRG